MILPMVQVGMILLKLTGHLHMSWLMVFTPFYLMVLVIAIHELVRDK